MRRVARWRHAGLPALPAHPALSARLPFAAMPARVSIQTLRALVALTIGTLLSACVTAPREEPAAEPEPGAADTVPLSEAERWALQQAAVRAMGDWEVRGKVAWRVPDDAGSASLVWTQAGGDADLRLSGPLGVGRPRVVRDGALSRVRRDGIERSYPADAAPWLPNGALLPIPVESIAWWLRGVPDPARPIDELVYGDGRAGTIRQGGWTITIDAYDDATTPPLPARLAFEAPAADLTLRMIVRDWAVSASAALAPVAPPPASGDGRSSARSHH